VYLLPCLVQASCCQRVYGAVCSNRCVMWLLDAQERLLRTTLVAMIMDVLGSLLYIFDMYTDIKVRARAAPAALPAHAAVLLALPCVQVQLVLALAHGAGYAWHQALC
jgi:hypothetical protein